MDPCGQDQFRGEALLESFRRYCGLECTCSPADSMLKLTLAPCIQQAYTLHQKVSYRSTHTNISSWYMHSNKHSIYDVILCSRICVQFQVGDKSRQSWHFTTCIQSPRNKYLDVARIVTRSFQGLSWVLLQLFKTALEIAGRMQSFLTFPFLPFPLRCHMACFAILDAFSPAYSCQPEHEIWMISP